MSSRFSSFWIIILSMAWLLRMIMDKKKKIEKWTEVANELWHEGGKLADDWQVYIDALDKLKIAIDHLKASKNEGNDVQTDDQWYKNTAAEELAIALKYNSLYLSK